jgi:hypothetical protein
MVFSVRRHDHHGSLLVHLMQRARRAKLAGATAFEAFEGYGSSGEIHRTRSLSDDAPVTLIIVDRPERIDAFLEDVADMLSDVFVTVVDVDVVEL